MENETAPESKLSWLPGVPRLAVLRLPARQPGRLPAIFLHGLAGTRATWAPTGAALAAGRDVLVPELRGYGDSDPHPPGPPLRFADLVGDAERALEAVGGRAHVLGLSAGGLIAQGLAARRAEGVASLTLVASRRGDRPVAAASAIAERHAAILERGGVAALADVLLPALCGPEATAAVRDVVREGILALRIPGYLSAMRAWAGMEAVAEPAALRLPALVIGGGADRLVPQAEQRALADAIPNARLVIVQGAGHLVSLEAPDLFRELVRRFWSEAGRGE